MNVLSNVHPRVFTQVFGCSRRCLGVCAGVQVFAQVFRCSRSCSSACAGVDMGVASARESVVGDSDEGFAEIENVFNVCAGDAGWGIEDGG